MTRKIMPSLVKLQFLSPRAPGALGFGVFHYHLSYIEERGQEETSGIKVEIILLSGTSSWALFNQESFKKSSLAR